MENMKWSFYNFWNESLETKKERPLSVRSNIWASELGGAMVDRYLKMNAVPFTNPPNPRSLRKFEAGNLWEAIIGYVLKRAGIIIYSQGWVSYSYPGLLEVTGKMDFIAGGVPDFERSAQILKTEFDWLPETIKRGSEAIIKGLQSKNFMGSLEKIVLEIKSCGSFMFDVYEKAGVGNQNHILQLFHYLKAKDMPEGHIVYICKDDCRMLEIGVYNPSGVENDYKKDIESLTHYINKKEIPPKEEPIVFNQEFGRFSANWKIGYSVYLKKIYGFAAQMDFDNKYKPVAEKWNRVFGRCVKEEKMTKLNLEVIKEIKKTFPEFDELVSCRKKAIKEHKKKEEKTDFDYDLKINKLISK